VAIVFDSYDNTTDEDVISLFLEIRKPVPIFVVVTFLAESFYPTFFISSKYASILPIPTLDPEPTTIGFCCW
jgi:hypothetical protein